MSAVRVVASAVGTALVLAFAFSGMTIAAEASSGVLVAADSAHAAHHTSVKHAPVGPPLTSSTSTGGEEGTTGVPSAEGDQLVENGLSSPLCEGPMDTGLSSAAQSDCETSGFVGAPAPTNDYDLDVNIDVGALGLSSGELLSVIQDVFIAPVWQTLVWGVHALVVMLQWCYTLELLGGSTMSRVASSLREAQASFTQPWLVLVLAVTSILVLYNGLVRRRVAQTLGEALMTIAMMGVGLWVIADPLGTIGVVGQLANRASLGTLGAVAQGTTANAPRTLGDSMRALFAGAIEVPWCYLEFGNVRWCSDPALLEPRLRQQAASIAASEQAKLGCKLSTARAPCSSGGEASALDAEHTSVLVREADTNGALFLAFPANGPQRNSVKNSSSLLHILCRSEDDTKCVGSTAAQAEFRSDSGTFPRMIGVVLIAVGVLGMTMLFGLIAIHLLASAVFSLFMLLLAPFAVLTPAFGDAGRAIFAGWLTRLLGAVSSKLIFSFVLGALLTMQHLLVSLEPLGWWTQWLLISSFWWTVFFKRHEALAFVRNGGRGRVSPHSRTIGQRIEGGRRRKEAIAHPVRFAKHKLLSPAPADEQLPKRGHTRNNSNKRVDKQSEGEKGRVGRGRRTERAEYGVGYVDAPPGDKRIEQVERNSAAQSTEGDGAPRRQTGESSMRVGLGRAELRTTRQLPPSKVNTDQARDASVQAAHAQLERVRAARKTAVAGGDRRRAATLAAREQLIEARLVDSSKENANAGRPSRQLDDAAGKAHRSRGEQPASDRHRHNPISARVWSSREIMDDARELAARYKRQLDAEPSAADDTQS